MKSAKTFTQTSIRDWPATEQPTYRAAQYGTNALSSAELLHLVLGLEYVEPINALLSKAGNLVALSNMPVEEIEGFDHIGRGRALKIKAALELGRRAMLACPDRTRYVRSPVEAAEILAGTRDYEQEHLSVILLDTRNSVIGVEEIYIGTVNSAQVRIAEIFRPAIRRNAAAIVVSHNHPSGDPSPSAEDVRVTRAVVEAGKLMDIDVLDHVVVGNPGWVSMKERGLGF